MSKFNIKLPEEVYEELKLTADREGVTVEDLLKRFIKLLLIAATNNGGKLLYQKPDGEIVELVP